MNYCSSALGTFQHCHLNPYRTEVINISVQCAALCASQCVFSCTSFFNMWNLLRIFLIIRLPWSIILVQFIWGMDALVHKICSIMKQPVPDDMKSKLTGMFDMLTGLDPLTVWNNHWSTYTCCRLDAFSWILTIRGICQAPARAVPARRPLPPSLTHSWTHFEWMVYCI